MAICYYISAHGLGHATRSAAIINRIPCDIPVVVRSAVHPVVLSEMIDRPFRRASASFDCGVIQSDGFSVNPEATLAAYEAISERNKAALLDEVAFLHRHDVRLLVSDVPSFPLRAAAAAGLRSVLIGNFTWASIYEPFLEVAPRYRAIVAGLRDEYALATTALRLPFSLPMSESPGVVDVPLVCRPATSMRPDLARSLDLDPSARWVLLYLGQQPVDFDWSRLATIERTCFLVIASNPVNRPGVASVDPRRFDVADVVASCDIALGKPGYGTIADCVAGDTPLVYALPVGFAESDALDVELGLWGRAVRIDRETLFFGDLRPALDQAAATVARKEYPTNGAEFVAGILGQQYWVA